MTDQFKLDVGFALSLDTELPIGRRYSEEDDTYVDTATLGELIVQETARQLAAKLVSDVTRYQGLKTMAADRVRELIDQRVQPMLDEAFANPIPLTNTYGEPTGKSKTLREMVIETAQTAMNRRTDNYGRNKSVLEEALEKVTVKVLGKELQEEIESQKAQVRAALKDSAASVLAQSMAKQMGV